MVRELNDNVLREIAEPVKEITNEIKNLLNDMEETLEKQNGIGLAAPQIGISLRIIIVKYENKTYKIINPEIFFTSGIQIFSEGCLSLPKENGLVRRAEKIRIKGYDENGKAIKINTQKFLAQIFQHEIDHLDGILFTDKIIK